LLTARHPAVEVISGDVTGAPTLLADPGVAAAAVPGEKVIVSMTRRAADGVSRGVCVWLAYGVRVAARRARLTRLLMT
jgi:hypothetical protein